MKDTKKQLTPEEKVDIEELVRELIKLPEKEREKIYYMIQGRNLFMDARCTNDEMLCTVM